MLITKSLKRVFEEKNLSKRLIFQQQVQKQFGSQIRKKENEDQFIFNEFLS